MTATPPIVDPETWQKQIDTAARQGEGAHPRGDAIAEARWRLPMVEVDPTSAVVGAAGGVPLIDTFQEPVAAVCVGARRRVLIRTAFSHVDRPPGQTCPWALPLRTQLGVSVTVRALSASAVKGASNVVVGRYARHGHDIIRCRCSLNSGPVMLFENWATWLV